jgi:hypothetical protein
VKVFPFDAGSEQLEEQPGKCFRGFDSSPATPTIARIVVSIKGGVEYHVILSFSEFLLTWLRSLRVVELVRLDTLSLLSYGRQGCVFVIG